MGAQDQRPRFYEGQYLGAEDLSAIVDYLRAADARHALGEHTWGIAIGLYLLERPAPGAPDRREVILTPGVAWDGFGRAIVVTRPTRLPEDKFATIPYADELDSATAGPKGRAVRVWLNYSEIAARQPPPGFESCSDQEQNARVAEGFDFVVGTVPEGPNRHANVLIGTETLQATEALSRFDSGAEPLYDESVPHQTFPGGKKPPRWLVPVGLVRWVAREDDVGYFASSDGVPEYRIKDCTRGFRRYIGAVVENLVAADGAIVLQRRGEDPSEHHKLAWLLNCGGKSEELLDDLVWIEGNLRVVGDAKLAGGRLLMDDADGEDEGAPIYLQRTGDDPKIETKKCCDDSGATDAAALAKAPREFRAAIGAKGQNAHRFIVGPEVPPDTSKKETMPSLAPRLVVLSGTGETDDQDVAGRVGVNTRDPNAALEVNGDWNTTTLEDGAVRLSGKQPTIRFEGGDDVGNRKWITQLTDSPSGALRIAYRIAPTTAGGKPDWRGVLNVMVDDPVHKLGEKVGIRTTSPGAPLGVRADGDYEDLVSFEDKAGSKKWKIDLKPDAHAGLNFQDVANDQSCVFLKPGGDVGIGTTDPQGRLTVYGKVQPNQGQLSLFTDSADFVYDGGGDKLFIFSQAPAGVTSFLGAKVGIGGTAPYAALSVRGTGNAEELVSFENAAGTTKWHINQKLAAAPVKGFNIAETGVKDGRLFIKEGGDVGIGTYDPKQKLHVDGTFLLVEGAGSEKAYLGGDGSSIDPAQNYNDWFNQLLGHVNGMDDVAKGLLIAALALSGLGWVIPAVATVAGLEALGEGLVNAIAGFFGMGPRPPAPSGGALRDVQVGSLDAGVRMVHFWNASGTSGWMDIVCQSAVALSDARHKTEVEPLSGALGTVCSLRGVRFQWQGAAARARPGKPAMGVIAQEVAQVAPHMVHEVRGSLGVAYNEFIPLLIEAVKELKGEVDDLRAQLGQARKTGKKTAGK